MRKRNLVKTLSLCMAAVLALSFAGCRKTETETETPHIEGHTYLTNIYRGTDILMDDDMYLGNPVEVSVDNIVFKATKRIEHGEWDDEGYAWEEISCLYTVPTTGGVGTLTELGSFAEDSCYVENTYPMPDGGVLVLLVRDDKSGSQSYYLRLFRDGEMAAESAELSTLFPASRYGQFNINTAIVDQDGYIYLASEATLLILTPELTVAANIPAEEQLNEAIVDGDGTIYFKSWNDGEAVLVPVDCEAKTFGTPLAMPENLDMDGFFFGDGKTLYGYNDCGIYKIHRDTAEGEEPLTLVVDFVNSNLTGSINLIRYVPGGKFLIRMHDTLTFTSSTAIYEKVPDIDLSTVTTLQVCYTSGNYLLPSLTAKYNREHPDKRVVLTEYDPYEEDERLGQEIRTGTYTPDVVLGSLSDDTYRSLIKDDCFVDLMPFVEADDTLNRENLFGCVFNSFMKDGKLYGIPRKLAYRTILANKSIVGEREGWTTHEFIEFLNTLPENVTYMSSVSQENYWDLFGGQSEMLSAFVNWDERTCSFDSEDFVSLLRYIVSLPQKSGSTANKEVSESNPYGEFTSYRTGKTAAVLEYSGRGDFSGFIHAYGYFGKDNMVYCGYPTAEGTNGTLLLPSSQLCTILSSCEDISLTWDYIKFYISYLYADGSIESGLSSLHSQFPKAQNGQKIYYHLQYNGGMRYGTGKPDADGTYRGEPGDFYTSDDIDFAGIEKWLDEIGSPVLRFAYPEALTNIITEEIGSYLGGARSAEETAKMLQSRVSLYLAEQN